MKLVRARLIVEGRVQGVYFRANTVTIAKTLGVSGFVMNKPDGTVEAVLEGNEADVKKVIGWCRVGPPRARVDTVNVKWEDFKSEFSDFTALTRDDG
ncbi:acylphosphatase [bacterium]|nr:MAG: acylphosphatase [bacterium]